MCQGEHAEGTEEVGAARGQSGQRQLFAGWHAATIELVWTSRAPGNRSVGEGRGQGVRVPPR